MSAKNLKPGWKMVKFGDVVKNANLVERDPEAAGIERIVGLEHLDPENLHIRRWNTPENGTSFTRKFVPGQTLFGKRRAYQRKVAFAEFEGICSGDILTFEPKDKKVLLPELLPFICQSDAFFDHALGTSAGSLSPRTSWKALKNFEFPLPPIKEQKRIAEILWAMDDAVEKYILLREKSNDLYIAAIEKYIFAKSNTEAKVEELAEINSSTLSESKTPNDFRFKYLDIGSVTAPKVIGDLAEYVFSEAPSRARRVVKDGDILLSTVRPNLQSFVRMYELKETVIASTGFAVISPRNQSIGSILFHAFFSSRFARFCEARVTGTSYPAISAKDIGKFKVFIPNTDKEMREIGRKMDAIDRNITRIDSNIFRLRALRSILLNKLIGIGAAYV
jgi:type I restriction enzyme S subunit